MNHFDEFNTHIIEQGERNHKLDGVILIGVVAIAVILLWLFVH